MTKKTDKWTRARAKAVMIGDFRMAEVLDQNPNHEGVAAVVSTAVAGIEDRQRQAEERLLKIGEVSRLAGLSKTEIHRRVRESSDFPRPYESGGVGQTRRLQWRHSDIMEWIEKKALAR